MAMTARKMFYRRVASYLADGAVALGDLSVVGDIDAQNVTVSDNVTATAGDITASSGDVVAPRFLAGDGSAASPSYSFQNDTDSGRFRQGANNLRDAVAGAYVTNIAASLFSVSGALVTTSYAQLGGSLINIPRVADVAAAAGTISVVAGSSSVVRVTLSAGAIVSTATPFLADGSDGQEVWLIRSSDAGALTLSDEATLAGSNLRLSAATLALGPRDVLGLRFVTALGDWVQFAYENNL